MKNDNLLDQFFLVDEQVVKDLVAAVSPEVNDKVLEIGAGKGMLTLELSKKAGKVTALEIDESFKEELKKLPKNVEVIFGDALDLLEKKLHFNKITGSLPSSLVEPLIVKLVKIHFKKAAFLVPLKFVDNLTDKVSFTAYLETHLLGKVEKKSFSPQPKTNWALVTIERKEKPLLIKDYERYIQQYLLEHPQAKLKNALMEIVIRIYQDKKKNLTKNQAREVVKALGVDSKAVEDFVSDIDIKQISSLLCSNLKT